MKAAEIKQFAPKAKPELVGAIVRNWGLAEEAGIVTPLRVQHFMTQIATETGGLAAIEESLNYSVAGLRATFQKHRISDADVKRLGRRKGHKADQESIADIVYGRAWGAKNLGNTKDGDGWRYRGGGMMQTTGRENYRKLGFEDNPEALRQPDTAFATAVREWRRRGCNELADKDNLEAVRRKINGGLNGIDHARAFLKKAKVVWKTVTPTARPAAPRQPIPVAELAPVSPAKPMPQHTDSTIRFVQQRLCEAGYPEIGEIDGKLGNRTYDTIAAFRSRLGLPATPRDGRAIDLQLIETLRRPLADIEREIPKERAEKPKAEIAKKSKTIKTSWWARMLTALGLGGGVSADAIMQIANPDNIESRLTVMQRLMQFGAENWIMLLGIGVAATAAIGGFLIVERIRVNASRQGRAF